MTLNLRSIVPAALLLISASAFSQTSAGSGSIHTDTRLGDQLSSEFSIPFAHAGATGLNFTLRKTEIGIRYQFMTDRPENELTAKGYNVLNLSLSYKSGPFNFIFSLENQLDEKWNKGHIFSESKFTGDNAVDTSYLKRELPSAGAVSINFAF